MRWRAFSPTGFARLEGIRHRREQARRGQFDRRDLRREFRAGRLHAARHQQLDHGQSEPLSQSRQGPAQAVRAGRHAGDRAAGAAGAARSAGARLRDFIGRAKKQPPLNVASAGTGTISHLTEVLLEQRTGGKTAHIPFRGAAPAVTAVLGKHVDAAWLMPAPALPYIASGQMKAIAGTGPRAIRSCRTCRRRKRRVSPISRS